MRRARTGTESRLHRYYWEMIPTILIMICFFEIALPGTALPASHVQNRFQSSRFGLHYAGPHNAKLNTCDIDFDGFGCSNNPGEFHLTAPEIAGRYDIYIVALCVEGRMVGARYGISCEGQFYFYGWSKCSEFEIPTSGWPGCGEANAQTWREEQPGFHVALGVLDVYAYSGVSSFGLCPDQRVGVAEYCDGSQPSPICKQITDIKYFARIGFGQPGYDVCPCYPCPVNGSTWGRVKTLYR